MVTDSSRLVVIAGGSGFLGRGLARSLLERGYEIDVIDLFWFGDYLPDSVTKIKKGLFDLTQGDIKSYDEVIFLAGLSNDPMAEYSPSLNFIHNAAAPAYLGYISKIGGVRRFIYASSCSVYGYTENKVH